MVVTNLNPYIVIVDEKDPGKNVESKCHMKHNIRKQHKQIAKYAHFETDI